MRPFGAPEGQHSGNELCRNLTRRSKNRRQGRNPKRELSKYQGPALPPHVSGDGNNHESPVFTEQKLLCNRFPRDLEN